MDSARPEEQKSLLSLQEAAKKLAVSPATLINLNDYNILKPTITLTGEIGYTQEQIDQFIKLQQLSEKKPTGNQLNAPVGSSELPSNERKIPFALIPQIQKINKVQEEEEKEGFHFLPKGKFPSFVAISTFSFLLFLSIFFLISNFSLNNKSDSRKRIAIHSQAQNLSNSLANKPDKDTLGEEKVEVLGNKIANNDSSNMADGSDSPSLPEIPFLGKNNESFNKLLSYVSKSSCPDCAEKATSQNSVFDEEGNIKAEEDKKSSIALAGLSEITDEHDKIASSQSINPLLILAISGFGAVTIFFLFRNQFSLSKAQITNTQSLGLNYHSANQGQKVIEINQKTDGTVSLSFQGKEYKISKPELDSESDQFISRLMELTQTDVKEIEYDSLSDEKIRFNAPLSKLVTRLGFVGIKRDLFFPRTSKTKVLFRKYVTEEDLIAMSLPKNEISSHL